MFYSFISNSYRWVPLLLHSNAPHTKTIFWFLQYRHRIYAIYLARCHFGTLSPYSVHRLHITCQTLVGITTSDKCTGVEQTSNKVLPAWFVM